MKLAIVTACPSGVANSFIAAGVLERACKTLNWDASIECHSSVDQFKQLSAEDIQSAEIIIIASNTPLDTTRFIGKKVYSTGISACLTNTVEFLNQAVAQAQLLSAEQAVEIQSVTLTNTNKKKIVGITACPTGVAHTFMSAEAFEDKATEMGYEVKVERRGSVGAKNGLTASEIAEADLVIIAADIDVPLDRFEGKKLYKTSTGAMLKNPQSEIEKGFEYAVTFSKKSNGSSGSAELIDANEHKGPYRHLMTGVSYMLPIVVAGGLLIALSFAFGIYAFKEPGTFAHALMTIGGGTAFKLMIPVFSAYIAFSIADRPGLAPGFVGGMLATTTGAGFLGGIASGFIAGYFALFLVKKIKLPQSLEALKPILIIPFIASLVTGLIMIYLIGGPVSHLMEAITHFLKTMGTTNALLLGALLGAMMAFDLGGPVNKAAYTFGVGLLTAHTYAPMAAIMAAGMTPPLGMWLATVLRKKLFSESERSAGKAAFVLGLSFITEGAIPFAAKDPLRVIPCCMAGSAVAGALSMIFGVKLLAPHGGVFVFFIPGAVNFVMSYGIAILTGTVITGVLYSIARNINRNSEIEKEAEAI